MKKLFVLMLFIYMPYGCQYYVGTDLTEVYTDYIKIPIHETKSGHYTVQANLNRKRIVFMIDTGATISMVSEKAIEKFNLKRSDDLDRELIGVNITDKWKSSTIITNMYFKQVKINNFHAAIKDMTRLNESYKEEGEKLIDGIIGMNVLNHYQAVIDLKNKAMYLNKRIIF